MEDVAAELYGLPPSEFTAARDARAAEARRGGDRGRAAAIAALRRPTTAAWLVNLLVRRQPEEVEQLLELGELLREAQASLAGDQLRALSAQRRQLVRVLGQQAAGIAHDEGVPVSEDVRRQVEASVEAALADADAAAALRSGRLTHALDPTGGFDVAPATAATSADAAPRRRPAAGEKGDDTAGEQGDDTAAREAGEREERERRARELATAEQEAGDAEEVAEGAEAAAEAATSRVEQTVSERRAEERRVARLEAELEEAQEEVARLARALDADRAERDRRRREAEAARHRAKAARARVSRLRDRDDGPLRGEG